ncbi:MAG: PQQ-binding-like beta-propeller repeat protein [Aliishimia sp.]
MTHSVAQISLTGVLGRLSTSRSRLAVGFLTAALALSACDETRNTYLVGPREDLRNVLQDPDPETIVANEARNISLGPVQSNAQWAQFWGTSGQRTAHPSLSSAPQLVWSSDIGAGNSRKQRITADPVVAGGRVFTLDAGATVTATSTEGQVLWSRDLTPPGEGADQSTGGGLAFDGGRIFATLGFGIVAALDASDGTPVWSQDIEATGSGAPTVFGDLVYFVSGDDTGWAIEKNSGRIAWQIGAGQSVTNILGAPAPVIGNDLAIFSFGSGDVQAVFRKGGLRRWDAAVVGERRGYALSQIGDITAPPVVDGNQVYVGNQSGRTVALELASGDRVWTAQHGAVGPIWPAGDSLFMVTDRNELMRLSAADGSSVWATQLSGFVSDKPRRQSAVVAHFGPIVAGGRVVLVSSDGQMRSFDPTNGALISSVEIPGGAATAPAIVGGVLYVVNIKGQLLAYR